MYGDLLTQMLTRTSRAQRFPIRTDLHFRTPGEGDWLEGETENISRSGVLFHAPAPLEVNAPIELSFMLPVDVSGESGALVLCRGQVVRTLLPAASDAPPTMAAKFSEYRLLRE
jgi:pilus assembly protein Flp/PilA